MGCRGLVGVCRKARGRDLLCCSRTEVAPYLETVPPLLGVFLPGVDKDLIATLWI